MDYWHRIRQLAGTEPLIIPSTAGAIIGEGKILLVRHHSLKKWQIPGGVQEIGESVEQTVCREIREELGLDLKPRALIGIYSSPRWTIEYSDGRKVQQLIFFFLMEGQMTPIKIQESELTEYQFFAPDELPDDTMECCKQKVLDLTKYIGQTVFR